MDYVDEYGTTRLMTAIYYCKLDQVKQLCDQGVNIDAQDDWGNTALMIAAYHGQLEIVKELCDRDADLELKTKGGATALSTAAAFAPFDILKELCKRGAKVSGTVVPGSPTAQQFLTKQQFRWNLVVLMDILPVQIVREIHKNV